MRRFLNNLAPPPGSRWYYEVPETRHTVESTKSLGALLVLIAEHCKANGITVPGNIADVVADRMCANMPPGFCDGGGNPQALSFFGVVKRLELKLKGQRTVKVDEAEATRRARQCFGCAQHEHTFCTTCDGLPTTIHALLGRQLPRTIEAGLSMCRPHRFPAMALVWLQEPIDIDHDELPANCWRPR